MSKLNFRLGLWLVLAGILVSSTACRSAPLTGRRQLLLVPEGNEVTMGASAFQDVVTKETPSKNQQYIEMVSRVGQRIAAVAGKPDYQWEFRVVQSPEQNAFCLPGGKVVVYEGIIPICQSEAGLAVVMSHEVAHALARHGGERMSQGYAVDGAKQVLSYVTQSQEQQRRETIMKAYGVASQYGVILPYSRKHESEADHIGLMLMSKAGYDPAEAPRFWTRFGASHQGSKPSEFMSTHPSDERRAHDLFALLPEAQKLYEVAPQKFGLGEMIAVTAPASPAPPASGAPSVGPPPVGPQTIPVTGDSSNGGTLLKSAPAAGSTAPSLIGPPIRSF